MAKTKLGYSNNLKDWIIAQQNTSYRGARFIDYEEVGKALPCLRYSQPLPKGELGVVIINSGEPRLKGQATTLNLMV